MESMPTHVRAVQYTCPDWCAHELCCVGAADIDHEEFPELVCVPGGDPPHPLLVQRVRNDEIGPDGEQIVHAEETRLLHGPTMMLLSREQAEALAGALTPERERDESGAYPAGGPSPSPLTER